MIDIVERFNTLEKAIEWAKTFSKSNQGKDLHVIESRERVENKIVYYVDESGFVRIWEKLHAVYRNGRKQ